MITKEKEKICPKCGSELVPRVIGEVVTTKEDTRDVDYAVDCSHVYLCKRNQQNTIWVCKKCCYGESQWQA